MAASTPRTRDWGAILIWSFFGLAVAVIFAGTVFALTYTGSAALGTTSSARPTAASPGSGSATCSPSGTELHETAKGIAYGSTCLAAPANTAFTIAFANEDPGISHDIHVFTDPSATHSLFTGTIVTGPATVTYQVGALAPGTYFFRCDVHPLQMIGSFVVR